MFDFELGEYGFRRHRRVLRGPRNTVSEAVGVGLAGATTGPRRTLALFGLFLLCVAALVGGMVAWLEMQAAEVDRLPILYYEQPVWSEDESQLAYFCLPSHRLADGTREALARELWRTSRLGGEAVRITDLPVDAVKLLGWVDHDRSLLLQPGGSDQGPPRVFLVEVETGKRQEIRFEREGLQLIGARGGQIFFQRRVGDVPLEAARSEGSAESSSGDALKRRGVDLLTWTPGASRFTKLVSIPYEENDEITIDEAMPSPDGEWVAMALRLGGPQGTLGLWLYNVKEERLVWSTIRVEATAMRMAWDPTSRGLVAAAELPEGCDLFALWDVTSHDYSRLKSNSSRAAFRPFWPRGERHFLLLDGETIYEFEPTTLRAERVLSRSQVGKTLQDLAISARGNWAAFHSREGDTDNVYVVSLKTDAVKPVLAPGPRVEGMHTLWYQVADGLRFAGRLWLGGSGGSGENHGD